MRRLTRVGAIALLTALSLARPARADDESLPPLPKQLTIDVDAASIGFTFAGRIGQSRVLLGGGGGFGVSPILGRIVATGTHFDPGPYVNLWEVMSGQGFGRVELASWLNLDFGGRAGVFVHGGESYTGGTFAALFIAPALVWRWIWIGPRVSAGLLAERGGQSAAALTFDYLLVRFARSW